MLGDRAATRQWFTIVRRGAFGGDDTRFIRGSIGGVERWEEFSFVRLPRRRVERYPKTRRRFRASSHRDRVACVNDSTAISSFHCLSARSRATRGRSRRWGRETTPHREGEKITRSRAGTGNRAGNRARHGRRAANARTAPTALRRPRAFADQHPFVVTRQSIRIIPSRSRGRVDQLAARSFEFLLIAIAARRARARRLSSLFAGFPFVPFVRSVRIAVGGLPRSSCRPPPASSSSFSSSPRLGFESRARSLSRHRDFHSFVWVDEVLGFTSYDSCYMECTPGYIRWRSSRRLESRRRRRTDDARDRGRDDETFPSPGDGDDRTTSPSVRVIQPSSRVCLDSVFSFRALANRMNDRPTIRGENAVPPLATRSSIVRVVRVVRVVPTSTPTPARAVARTAPNATRRRAPARIVHSNRPESSRPPPFDCRSRPVFFFFSRVCDAHTAHAESSAKVDERERERKGVRVKTRARARWTYFRVTSSLFLTRTRRRTVASVRRRVLGDRAATRQWFTIVRRGAFGGDDTRFIRGSIGGVERWEEFSFVRLPRRRVERYPKTRRRFRASSHRDRVACVNDSTAISSFHCLSARSRATRGRSRRWGRETTPHREGEKITRSRAGTGNRAGNRARHGRRAANARTAPTALRRPRAFADQHPFVVTRQSIRIIPSRSRGRVDQLAARSFEFLLIAIAARRARARRLSSLFAGFPFVPFVRSVRIAVGGLPRSSCRPPPASSSSFSSSPRLGFESRARSLSRHRDFHSFVWVDEVLGFTSYDSCYMECTPGYIRWRSSRRLESRRRRRTDDARDRGRDDETFPSPGDGDDRTTSPSVRVIQPSSRVCLDSVFSFRALANRMNDRPTIRGENAVPPLATRSSIVRVVRVVRVVPTSTPTPARAVARTAPNATRRRAPARIVHSNRPDPPF